MQRKARTAIMKDSDLKEQLKVEQLKPGGMHSGESLPFKQSMVLVMKLTSEQKDKLCAARRVFVKHCRGIRRQREQSAMALKRVTCNPFLLCHSSCFHV